MGKIGSSDIAYHYIGSSVVPRVYKCEDTIDTPYTSFSADVLIIGGGGGGGNGFGGGGAGSVDFVDAIFLGCCHRPCVNNSDFRFKDARLQGLYDPFRALKNCVPAVLLHLPLPVLC